LIIKYLLRSPNTDNMGKLFVTLFALLLHSRQVRNAVVPGHAHLPAFEILHLDSFLAPIKLVQRHA